MSFKGTEGRGSNGEGGRITKGIGRQHFHLSLSLERKEHFDCVQELVPLVCDLASASPPFYFSSFQGCLLLDATLCLSVNKHFKRGTKMAYSQILRRSSRSYEFHRCRLLFKNCSSAASLSSSQCAAAREHSAPFHTSLLRTVAT